MLEKFKPAEPMPPEMSKYLRGAFDILRMQAHALSSAGKNMGRMGLSRVNELSIDVIKLLVDESKLFDRDDDMEKWPSAYEYFPLMRERIESGNLKPPTVDLTERQQALLTDLRVTYHFAWCVASKTEHGGAYADVPIGQAVWIIGSMLDPLVDQEKANQEWNELKDPIEDFEYFFRCFELRVKDELYPFSWDL